MALPAPGDLRPGEVFRDPDDAFFTPGYRRVITNEEFNDQIAQIDLRRRRIVWTYGRAGVAGSGAGELSNPDDAYRLPGGRVVVADIRNCRVLYVSPGGRIVRTLGAPGHCAHDPPRALESPNGDTPLADGGLLVTEIGGWVDRFDARGRLVFAVRTPTSYPSDAQLLPNGHVLVAGFNSPGRIDEITPAGRVVWTYGPASGPGALDRPSLAVRWPNGMIAATDDWHHRVVVIDPRTRRIVWQYGHLGVASAANGYLSKPDGLELLPAGSTSVAPLGRAPGAPAPARPVVRRLGDLAAPVQDAALAAVRSGAARLMGGLDAADTSRADTLAIDLDGRQIPGATLPMPVHDAAAVSLDGSVYLFGGGQVASTDRILRVELTSGRNAPAGRLPQPRSDLGAATVGGTAYLVGGFTGRRWLDSILAWRPGGPCRLVGRLPEPVRYAAVAAVGGRVVIVGGSTPAGATDAVLSFDPRTGRVARIGRLPAPLTHAAAAAVGNRVYVIGGRGDAPDTPTDRILSVDVAQGRIASVGRLPEPVSDAAAATVGHHILVAGGRDQGAPQASLLILSPTG